MMTLASVLFCVLVALLLGLALGIRAHRAPHIEPVVRAIMNIMQTVPIFSYLLPTLLLFGYGPSAALFATVAYAMPPMVHATVLALQAVPSDTLDLARMTAGLADSKALTAARRERLFVEIMASAVVSVAFVPFTSCAK